MDMETKNQPTSSVPSETSEENSLCVGRHCTFHTRVFIRNREFVEVIRIAIITPSEQFQIWEHIEEFVKNPNGALSKINLFQYHRGKDMDWIFPQNWKRVE